MAQSVDLTSIHTVVALSVFSLLSPQWGIQMCHLASRTFSAVERSRAARLHSHRGLVYQIQLLMRLVASGSKVTRSRGPCAYDEGYVWACMCSDTHLFIFIHSFCMSSALPAALIIRRWYGNKNVVCSVCNVCGFTYIWSINLKLNYSLTGAIEMREFHN